MMELYNVHGIQKFIFGMNDIVWNYIHISQENIAFDIDLVYLQILVFNTYCENTN